MVAYCEVHRLQKPCSMEVTAAMPSAAFCNLLDAHASAPFQMDQRAAKQAEAFPRFLAGLYAIYV